MRARLFVTVRCPACGLAMHEKGGIIMCVNNLHGIGHTNPLCDLFEKRFKVPEVDLVEAEAVEG